TAADGSEGLRMMKKQKPDLLITDIMMPEMDGLEVLQKIREDFPGLPVIAVSGGMRNGTINFLPVAEKIGACCALYKPVKLPALLRAVQAALA
ncbi:MAG: response regulator, partial [Kiritimatiellales bacterium]|nr:response regulator [Kiritimatiellales bacterium]